MRSFLTLTILAGALHVPINFAAAAPPDELLGRFASEWDEEAWTGGRGAGYIRPLDSNDWRMRMSVLADLVRHGEEARPALIEALSSSHVPTRILAAQTLTFLDNSGEADVLWEHLRDEPDAAVRLYLVDALGRAGGEGLPQRLDELAAEESNRDVRRYIEYARERENRGMDSGTLEALRSFEIEAASSMEVGDAAPDFTLQTVDGRRITLSDYRGKQPVVLVFIYGDT